MASLTCRICEYIHTKDDFTIYCTMCAYLHDIGKQFTPPEILQKTSRLTGEEYEIMKKHTVTGYNICIRDEKLRPYCAGPLYHHEALDGTGYPLNLSGNEIPLEAQIIRVADEFDAITSKRQYKSHVGVCETLNILISESTVPSNTDALHVLASESKPKAGKKFGKVNPKIVKALIKVVADDTEYELYNLGVYVEYLKHEAERLEEILNYENKITESKNDDEIAFYRASISELLAQGETIDNYKQVLEDYKAAYLKKVETMNKLDKELKSIKKLKM